MLKLTQKFDDTRTSPSNMSRPLKLFFLLPAYNEEDSIAELIQKIDRVCTEKKIDYRILVVNDGSTDNTSQIINDQINNSKIPIELLENKPNKGLGFSVKRGLKSISTIANSQDVIVTLDADLTQDPIYVSDMLEKLHSGADVVIASRYRKGSGTEGLSLFRHFLSIGAGLFMKILHPISGVRDYSCGFRMYRVESIRWGFLQYGDEFVTETGFACMVEIAARLRKYSTFQEIPFVLRYDAKRKPSEMKILSTIQSYLKVIIKVKQGESALP